MAGNDLAGTSRRLRWLTLIRKTIAKELLKNSPHYCEVRTVECCGSKFVWLWNTYIMSQRQGALPIPNCLA